jgi:hypothetical protein
MKSRVAGQIHDSVIGDVHRKELKDYLEIVHTIMTQDIRKAYPWLIVPLDIENEICPLGGTWHDKQVVGFKDGLFSMKDKTTDKLVTFNTNRELLEFLKPL